MVSMKRIDFPCDNCGAKMVNKGDSADSRYLVIECPVCGVSFLLAKAILRSKLDWERLFASILEENR